MFWTPFFAGAVADLQSKGGSIYGGPVSSLQFELKELVLAECLSLAPVTEKHLRLSEFTHIQPVLYVKPYGVGFVRFKTRR